VGDDDDRARPAEGFLSEKLPNAERTGIKLDRSLCPGNPVPAFAKEIGVSLGMTESSLIEGKPGEGSCIQLRKEGLISETGPRRTTAEKNTRSLIRSDEGGGENDRRLLRPYPGSEGPGLGPSLLIEGKVEPALDDLTSVALALPMAHEKKAAGCRQQRKEFWAGDPGIGFEKGGRHGAILPEKRASPQQAFASKSRRDYLLDVRKPSFLALAALPFLLTSCYITNEGFHYLGLLAKGRPITKVLADPSSPAATKILLRNAEDIEDFGQKTLGERPTRNFRKLVEIQGDTLVHVVQACASLSFDRYLWSYPLVGKLPYRGYFDLVGAEKEAARLRAQGLDVIVRDADAFSTLGWLSDPLWSFMADYSEADLADLILHESMHATAFRGGSDDWNEGIATFVGRQGSLLWLESRYGEGSHEVADAVAARKDAETFSAFLRETARQLELVYSSTKSADEKRKAKAEIIAARAALYKSDYDKLFLSDRYRKVAMEKINNAWLDLYRLYEGEPALYEDWYDKVDHGDLKAFVLDMTKLAKAKSDPLVAMRERLADIGSTS